MAEPKECVGLLALQGESDELRATNVLLSAEIERLSEKITELEQRLSKGSSDSSLPPSLDRPGHKAQARQNRGAPRARSVCRNGSDRRDALATKSLDLD